MKRQRVSENALTPWEVKQLMTLPGLRERLADELLQIHRCGSVVDAFASHTDLLTHMLAYAWRSTNALMRTCKRFHTVVHSRNYWKALARRAFASHVPVPVLNEVDWFHGLANDEVAYSYLWSCILSPKSKGHGLLKAKIPHTLFLTHYRADELLGATRRVLRLRWHQDNKDAPYWWSIATLSMRVNLYDKGGLDSVVWTPVYVTYFGHPTLRRRVFVAQEHHLLGLGLDDDPGWWDDPCFINCYCEVWDPEQQRTWHGTCPFTVSEVDTETTYTAWNPSSISRNWGVWK